MTIDQYQQSVNRIAEGVDSIAAKHIPREQRLEIAAQMTLLFHSGGHWDDEKRLEWARSVAALNPDSWRLRPVHITHPDATTKMLCDCVRKAIEP